MSGKFAIKILTKTDLTLFDIIYRQDTKSKQKGINLNKSTFEDILFPVLKSTRDRMPVELVVFGPKKADHLILQQGIRQSAGGRNWRLNGKTIKDPPGDPGRFAGLVPGDVALMRFDGEPKPSSVAMAVVSEMLEKPLRDALADIAAKGRDGMIAVDPAVLLPLAERFACADEHPLRMVADIDSIELLIQDATYGGEVAKVELRKRIRHPVTKSDFDAAEAAKKKIGEAGEAAAWRFLQNGKRKGAITDATWCSRIDAAGSWDFEVLLTNGTLVRLDAKSTSGRHNLPIHLSQSEIIAAADLVPYFIMRVSELKLTSAKIAISHPINSLARDIVKGVSALPHGVRPDGFSVDPRLIRWEKIVFYRWVNRSHSAAVAISDPEAASTLPSARSA